MSRARAFFAAVALAAMASCKHAATTEPPPPSDPPPIELPALVSSSPADGQGNIPRTTWIVLDFAAPADPAAIGTIKLTCAGIHQELTIAAMGDGSRLVVNPATDLPVEATCVVDWRGPGAAASISFQTAARGDPAKVIYDRDDPSHIEPIPDDLLLVADPSKRTGMRVQIPTPGSNAVAHLFALALAPAENLDGWSPIAPMVVELDAAPDPTTLPMTVEESLDPFATVALFDVDRQSTGRGQRIPFTLRIDDRPSASGAPSHSLVLFPARPLEPSHQHALVVLRRALVDPTRPIDPSSFMQELLADTAEDVGANGDVSEALEELVETLSRRVSPPIYADDIALVVSITTRSLDDVPNDVLAIRSRTVASLPPSFTITDTEADSDPNVAAMVHGTFQSPLWIDPDGRLHRDNQGKPYPVGYDTVPFAIALPKAALQGPVPAIMVQHGHPSDASFIVTQVGRGELAPAGLAAIGFTDIQSRRPDLVNLEYVFDGLLSKGRVPQYEIQTWADQLAFIRLIRSLESSLDVLPLAADGTPAPDGILDLDGTKPLDYGGFSAGSFHGLGLIAYAPELRAAVLSVGAGNWAAKTMLQKLDSIHDGLTTSAPDLSRADVYALFTLGQMAFDAQDPLIHARFARRSRVLLARGPSLLLTEGIGDTLVPVEATRSAAWQLGVPQLGRVAQPVPFLTTVDGPLTGNLDPLTTGAFVQFVPVGVDGIEPTPACAATNETVAHFCADISAGVGDERVPFFTSALTDGTPTIGAPNN